MTLELGAVTIDCEDPHRLAQFWTAALGVEIAQDHGDFLFLSPAEQGSVSIGLQRVPEPLVGKNRLHLDLGADDQESEVARLIALGAKKMTTHEVPGFSWTVLTDPEGNQFCVSPRHH